MAAADSAGEWFSGVRVFRGRSPGSYFGPMYNQLVVPLLIVLAGDLIFLRSAQPAAVATAS